MIDTQSSINFVGSVLPVLAAFIPGLAQVEGAIVVVEDGIKVEQALNTWFTSPMGIACWKNLTRLFSDLGISIDFDSPGHITVTPMPDRENPYSPGYIMGSAGGGE